MILSFCQPLLCQVLCCVVSIIERETYECAIWTCIPLVASCVAVAVRVAGLSFCGCVLLFIRFCCGRIERVLGEGRGEEREDKRPDCTTVSYPYT